MGKFPIIEVIYCALVTLFVTGIFHGGKIGCLVTVTMFGFLILALLLILLCATLLVCFGGKNHERKT
jgi:hypothetical protein